MIFYDLEQDSPEWHELRKTKIGASMAPIIMGVSPYMTPYQLWEEMVGLREPQEENECMKRGKLLEEEARQRFIAQTGIEVSPKVAASEKYTWMMASFDGINSDNTVIVEIKCPGSRDHKSAQDGVVPKHYYPQLQHQMIVADVEEMYYFSYGIIPNFCLTVKRDVEYQEKLRQKTFDFMQCVFNFIPPELTERDFVNRDDDEWTEVASDWFIAHSKLKQYEKMEKEARSKLVSLSGESSCRGSGVNVRKVFRKGTIDYSYVAELYDIDYEKYRNEGSFYHKISLES